MKFFAALKSAEFAAKLSEVSGFDFKAALEAGDVNALKAFVDGKVAEAIAAEGNKAVALAAQVERLESSLEDAAEQNKSLSESAKNFTVINGALASSGFKFSTDASKPTEAQIAACKKALDEHVKIAAGDILGAAGHRPIKEAGENGKATISRAAFNALPAGEQFEFCKNGGRITD